MCYTVGKLSTKNCDLCCKTSGIFQVVCLNLTDVTHFSRYKLYGGIKIKCRNNIELCFGIGY